MREHAFFEGWPQQEYAFKTMIEPTAHRPFVYRALVPWTTDAIDAALPQTVRDRYQAAAAAGADHYARPGAAAWRTPERERKYMIAFVLSALCGVGALWALRDAGPLYFGMLLPLSFMHGGFMYDHAALLVAMIAAALRTRLPRRDWLRVDGSAAAASAACVLLLKAIYAGHPGSALYDHIEGNLAFWIRPESWFASMNVFVPLLAAPRGLNLAMIVPLLVVLAWRWRERPAALRHLLLASAAINLRQLLTS